MRNLTLALSMLSLLAFGSAAPAQDKDKDKDKGKDEGNGAVTWCIDDNVTLVYQVADTNNAGEAPESKKTALVSGVRLKKDGSNDLDVNAWGDSAFKLLFTLPGGEIKERDNWHNTIIFTIANQTYHAEGEFLASKKTTFSGEQCWLILGSFDLLKVTINRAEKVVKTKVGHIDTKGYYKVGNSLLLLGSYAINFEKDQAAQGEAAQVKYLNAFDLTTADGIRDVCKLAIGDGQRWLTGQQRADGSWVGSGYPFGTTALAVSALLQSGVSSKDATIARGFAFINSKEISKTYDAALLLMAIEGKYLPLQNYEDVLAISDQDEKATIWARLSGADKNLVVKAIDFLEKNQAKDGHWGYPEHAETNDNSNTQFAALGLRAGSRVGRKIDLGALHKLVDHFVRTQQLGAEGKIDMTFHPLHTCTEDTKNHDNQVLAGWGYRNDGTNPTINMTGAGLVSLMSAYLELKAYEDLSADEEKEILRAMHGGLAWFSNNYSIPDITKLGWREYYFFYTLANVGMSYRVRSIKESDWYREAATAVIQAVQPDGSWRTHEGHFGCESTSFALLFLQKALLLTRE